MSLLAFECGYCELTRLCIFPGIRFQADFCFDPAAVLCGLLSLSAHALHVTSTISNQVPVIDAALPEDMTYCIWFPDLLWDCDLVELVLRFHPLPTRFLLQKKVRKNGNDVIFNLVMKAHCRCKTLDDYDRTINIAKSKPDFESDDAELNP
ncbi:hypothetical protein LY78DRAFT_673928 [Colletotrichum sublineola]|uniref:Uncharacterized protein n=1 Tax=Colletotrichum sublineola TaxID=1173701 RepID=A0A066XNI1_COLSU|nr:hypothetical protein LY78DRAFT_673928 [Colletotrichum sublineola]KDN67585.1 hypothetical protein CSUB01_04116 [Colletotrichum sublineola]